MHWNRIEQITNSTWHMLFPLSYKVKHIRYYFHMIAFCRLISLFVCILQFMQQANENIYHSISFFLFCSNILKSIELCVCAFFLFYFIYFLLCWMQCGITLCALAFSICSMAAIKLQRNMLRMLKSLMFLLVR